MNESGFAILRQLISDIEGAPYPIAVNNELYAIWYEHVQEIAQDALEFLNVNDPNNRQETELPDIQ